MASTSSRSSARLRDKDKVVRGAAAGRDIAEAPVRSSRTTRRSNPEPQLQYTTINNVYGDIQITKGPLFGRALDEDSGPSQRSHPALPGRQNVYAAAAPRPRRIIADEDDDTREESDDIESSRNFSGEDEPSNALLLSRATPTPAQQVQTDSGYRSATRRSKQGKKEAYRASLNKKLSNAPLRESHSSHKKRKTKPRAVESNESNNEDSATSDDNEKHLATQGDDEGDGEDGGNDDDSDDDVGYIPRTPSPRRRLTSSQDFARRQMKVATFDNEAVAANVLLDTGTKPDWISNYFLTEKLHRKYTRLNDEESKREYIDFNGNKFNAVGKAELMIYSTDFSGFSCRTLSFLVATGRNFEIILGKRTTQKEKLLCRRLDPQMEGAYPAVQTDIKKGEPCLKPHHLDLR